MATLEHMERVLEHLEKQEAKRQLTLPLMPPAARKTDPETSHQAADEHQDIRANDRRRALEIDRAHPEGLTDHELGALMGRQQTSAGKRRCELRDAGYIVDSGQRRPTPSGSTAIVWKINKGEGL